MVEQPLVIERRHFPGGTVLALKGDLTKMSEQELLGDLTGGLGEHVRFLALDLTGVAYINSGGMAVLIRLARIVRKAGAHTFAWGVTPHYEKLFRMVGLTEWLMLYPNEFAVMQRIEALEL
ncbi:STAS domain-containing protein [Paenibacillus sp. GCM10027626]|uniref:STAS domain-containing protein n=1 Tax=Paenibacillus sp. GCM10027626 TaxID=3273411 RepID=UPI00363F0067